MNPVINVGTEKNPMMVLCATTMVMMYEEATGKNFGDDMDDYVNYCDGYRDGYNTRIESMNDYVYRKDMSFSLIVGYRDGYNKGTE